MGRRGSGEKNWGGGKGRGRWEGEGEVGEMEKEEEEEKEEGGITRGERGEVGVEVEVWLERVKERWGGCWGG